MKDEKKDTKNKEQEETFCEFFTEVSFVRNRKKTVVQMDMGVKVPKAVARGLCFYPNTESLPTLRVAEKIMPIAGLSSSHRLNIQQNICP